MRGAARPRRLVATLTLSALCACSHGGAHSSSRVDSPSTVSVPSPDVDQPRWRTPLSAYLAERNLCIDRELARRDLNEYGDARGTKYAEGAPQGVATTLDRYNYVLRHRPEIGVVCTRSPAEPER